jgi:hypothetical protein
MSKPFFNPLLPVVDREGRVDIRNVRCHCGGVMFDVTIGLAHYAGTKQYECDMCHDRRAVVLPSYRRRPDVQR